MKNNFVFLFSPLFLFLASCAHFAENDVLEELAHRNGMSHIQSHCQLSDLQGKLVYRFDAYLCIFEDDGSIIASNFSGGTSKYDRKMKTIWHSDFELNHQLKLSQFSNEYLSIRNLYYDEKVGKVRYDELVIFDENGKILKSFNFKEYLNKLKAPGTPVAITARKTPVFEYSHINSLAETYKIENGNKLLNGYVSYDKYSQKIFFFDRELKLTSVSNVAPRALHDIKPISEDEFIYYLNEGRTAFSLIETYNRKTKEFKIYHENRLDYLTSKVCSSVQYLSPTELFIFHSACPAASNPPDKKSQIEAVNLQSRKSKIFPVDGFKESIGAELVNAEKFLRAVSGN